MDGSKVSRTLFRAVGITIAIILFISAVAFHSHHLHSASLVCLLFSLVIFLYIFFVQKPSVGWWLSLFGIVMVVLILLALFEV